MVYAFGVQTTAPPLPKCQNGYWTTIKMETDNKYRNHNLCVSVGATP